MTNLPCYNEAMCNQLFQLFIIQEKSWTFYKNWCLAS